jgi:hypothetical protein
LLDANPLKDIKAIKTIRGVFRKGVYMSREKLDSSLLAIEKWVKEKEKKENDNR